MHTLKHTHNQKKKSYYFYLSHSVEVTGKNPVYPHTPPPVDHLLWLKPYYDIFKYVIFHEYS